MYFTVDLNFTKNVSDRLTKKKLSKISTFDLKSVLKSYY